MSVEDLIPLLPLFSDLWEMWVSQGKDPKAELEALLAAADATADEAEKAKFGS